MAPEQLADLTEQLVSLLREKDFNHLFDRLTENESSNNRFLIKMALKHRCAPCQRVIDMRGEFGDLCLAHEYEGIIHFMPADAIVLFQSQCYLYRDSYTLGVYEMLQAWYKRQQGRNEALPPPASPFHPFDVNLIPFASHYDQREERMHFSSPLLLKFADGATLPARSTDISPGGIRILVPRRPDYQIGVRVEIIFTGLGREHAYPILRQGIGYQILGEECKEGKYWLRLVKSGDQPDFAAFLGRFIEQNRHRYRISVDYQLSSAIVRGYEQFYLPRMTGMPLFFSTGEQPRLEIALRTENNQHLLEYWRDTQNRDLLAGLFPPTRLRALLPAPGTLRETLIYCFTHSVRSQLHFFSATREELQRSGLIALFFRIGARRPSWRVYKFSLEACAPQEARLNGPQQGEEPSPQEGLLRERLGRIGYVGLLQEIGLDSQRNEFHNGADLQRDANELQCFGHPPDAASFEIETLHHVQLRKESRYAHKTAIQLRYRERTWFGWTRDISAQGMQIELEEPFEGEPDEPITVALPGLQTLARHMDLQHLPYRLIDINRIRTLLHLRIEGAPEQHIGHHFFSLLIARNQSKLKASKEQVSHQALLQALRNLFTHHLFNTPLYINTIKGLPKPVALGWPPRPRSLSRLLHTCAERDERANLYPLLQGGLLKTLLINPLRIMEREDRPREEEIYIASRRSPTGAPLFHSRLASSFADLAEKRRFVELALQQGEFYSVLIGISRTGSPDTRFIANELDYIAKFAIHKAIQLEEELWSVVGVGELTDTSQATLFRLGLSVD